MRRGSLQLEQLEQRALLAIDSGLVGNHFRAQDVNRDGIVSPIDALQVINFLNRNGAQTVAAASAKMAASAAVPGSDPLDFARFDVNGDGVISPRDALMVINQLNDPDIVRIRLAVTDLSGNPISQITQNNDFQLRVYVQDLRGDEDGGVFSAVTDITFDASLAVVNGPITAASPYGGALGDISSPGLIDNASAVDGLSPLGPSERLLLTIPMRAIAGGSLTLASSWANANDFEVLVYNTDDPVLADQIEFGTITIDVLAVPTISIDNVSQAEGDSGFTDFTFTVTLSDEADDIVTVEYSTAPGTATADVDFVSASGVVVFEPGETTKTIVVQVIGDEVSESNETFFVNLGPVTGPAELLDAQGLGTIIDDDGLPSLSIDDVSETEGNTGTKEFVFTVTLSGLTDEEVTVDYTTVAGTATAGVDFVATSGSLVLSTANPTQTITVLVNGDLLFEADETFTVVLSDPSGAEIGKAVGLGTILNDDPAPQINIADAGIVIEPAAGTADAVFVVTLTQQAGVPITVNYATQAGTATAGADFTPASGQITFAPGETEKTITVHVLADADEEEGDETFFVNLSAASAGTIGDGQGQATIRDQGFDKVVRIRLSFTDLLGNEIEQVTGGDPFYLNVFVQDLRDVPANQAGVFQAYLDVLYENDFLSVIPNTHEFGSPYDNDQVFQFSDALGLIDDSGAFDGTTPLGPEERLLFRVQVRGLTGGTTSVSANPADALDRDVLLFSEDLPIPPSQIQFLGDTIDILQPSVITTSNVSVTEGDAGTKQMTFTVQLERVDDRTVTVNYATVADTATPGVDYQNTSGTLTFGPGVTTQTINVTIIGDTLYEFDETFFLNLSGATNAVVAPASTQVVGTILNDDAAPVLAFNDVTVIEGLSDAEIVLQLSAPSGRVVTLNYATGGGTATPGADYTPVSGQLTFQPGETTKTIVVPVIRDAEVESDETFLVTFTNVQGATLSRPSATVTIQDLPPASISGYVYGDVNGNGIKDNGDLGLGGVTVQLVGETVFGDTVVRSVQTNDVGMYSFAGLAPGLYRVIQVQPSVLQDGDETVGNAGGYISANDEFTITLGPGVTAEGYNFGERGILAQFLTHNIFFATTAKYGG